jgi:hypothetical protein
MLKYDQTAPPSAALARLPRAPAQVQRASVPAARSRTRDLPTPTRTKEPRMIPKRGVRFSDKIMRKKEGGGAPEGAPSMAASCDAAARHERCACAHHPLSGALASRRSTAVLAGASERSNSAQAALHADERMRALPAPSTALKQSTLRAGHHAGGDVARTARGRSYEPHPQEPHPLRFRDRLEKRPS